MTRIRNLVFGCAMGIASAIAPMGAAGAAPLAVPDMKAQAKSDVTKAQVDAPVSGPGVSDLLRVFKAMGFDDAAFVPGLHQSGLKNHRV